MRLHKGLAGYWPILGILGALHAVAPALATTYSGFCGGITDSAQIYVVPKVARPTYLTGNLDGTFGTKIFRIAADSNVAITGIGSSKWGGISRHHYSKDQPWNSTSTKIMIDNSGTYGGTPSKVLLDGKTYAVLGTGVCGNWGPKDSRWQPHTSYPNIRIGVTYGLVDTIYSGVDQDSLWWVDITTCTISRGWKVPIRPHLIGQGEGNASYDGRWIAISSNHKRINPSRPDSIVIVDMNPPQADSAYSTGIRRVGPPYAIPACSLSTGCAIGNISISASGRYVDVKYTGTGEFHRIFKVDSTTLSLSIVNMASGSYRCDGEVQNRVNGFILPLKHADMTQDPGDGNADVIVGVNDCSATKITSGRVAKVRLSDGSVTYISKGSTGGFTEELPAVHVSTRNQDRLGWAYVSYDTAVANADTLNKRYSSEIVAYKIDGSKHMQRFAHAHAVADTATRSDDDETQPVPSRDGKRIMFASDWMYRPLSPTKKREVKAYVMDATLAMPIAVDDLWHDSAPTTSSITVTWTAPADNLGFGVTSYVLRYSTSLITAGNFSSASLATTGAPKQPGAAESQTVGSLNPDTRYYFALKSANACSTSAISNVFCTFTAPTSGPQNDCFDSPEGVHSPLAVLDLGVANPSIQMLAVRFSLPDRRPAKLVVFDVMGRVVFKQDLTGYAPGPHTLRIGGDHHLSPGLYLVQLRHPSRVMRARAVLVR